MTPRKICVVLTTRGNYAKTKNILSLFKEKRNLKLQLIVGGGLILPKYGKMVAHIENEGFKIDRIVHFLLEGENLVTMAKSAGLAITEFCTIFENLQPDVVVVIADRFESLSLAMAASYMNIPLAHIEGGEVSGSIDESIRHAITKLSHIHFPATADAAKRIEHMGESRASIFPVGCTSLDVIKDMELDNMEPLKAFLEKSGVGGKINPANPYLLVLQHPVTTEYEENLSHINETINAIHSLGMDTVWIWPNMDAGSDGTSAGIRIYRENKKPEHVQFLKSMPIELFAVLLNNAACVIGNSSSGIRESNFLGVPSVNIGTRQSGRERGCNVVDVDYNSREIEHAIAKQLEHGRCQPEFIYGDGDASRKIVEALESFEFRVQKQITY